VQHGTGHRTGPGAGGWPNSYGGVRGYLSPISAQASLKSPVQMSDTS
jgi:hypothetical protein